MNNEQTYTLDEARQIVRREECDRDGHDISAGVSHTFGGEAFHHIRCDRCGAVFREST